ncbi:MAG: heavy-metal-associated domain-containing protein [Rhodopirellula sp. JB055]|uniref:heavy-metal-associated domain-containing protein n=1 Tax=Rhodopirellula sp. JB055 TaxID=3342846 RepID=UPI00370B5E5E
MKSIVYVVAALAAVGIMVAISATPDQTPETEPTAAAVVATPEVMAEAGTMTLEVPEMHCQFACFPRVQETLEKNEAVSEVALVDQPDPNALTIKKVVVKYDAGFDVSSALAALQKEGFSSAQKVQ